MARKKSATGRTITSHGYVLLWMPGHHLADVRGYVYEHRLVAEEKLGRVLSTNEQIHHVDGDKTNNQPSNIEIVASVAHHRFKHRKVGSKLRKPDEVNFTVKCACGCGEAFARYDIVGRPRRFVSGHNLRIEHGKKD